MFSTDLGISDNQPIEETYHVIPYQKHDWIHVMPMHAHVFIRSLPLGQRDGAVNLRYEQHQYHYAAGVAQVNYALSLEAVKKREKGEAFSPQDAARLWIYVGINMTPPMFGELNQYRAASQTERDIVVHHRSANKIENWWGDCRGTDHLHFVFTMVETTKIASYVLSSTDVKFPTWTSKTQTVPLEFCPQIVAVRSPYRILSPKNLRITKHSEDDLVCVYNSDCQYAIDVPVGICNVNDYYVEGLRDDDKWQDKNLKDHLGVLCRNAIEATEQHIDCFTLLD